jgi:type II secretory pathway component PulJ
VATAILGFLVAAVMNVLVVAQQSYLMRAETIDAQQKLRLAIARVAQDLREAGFRANVAAAFPAVTGQTPTGFTIQNDWNGNGVIEPGVTVNVNGINRGEQTVYSLSRTALRRQESAVDAAPVVLAEGIQQFTLEYRDATDAVTAVDSSIVAVVLTLAARSVEPAAAGAVELVMTDRIRLRNR